MLKKGFDLAFRAPPGGDKLREESLCSRNQALRSSPEPVPSKVEGAPRNDDMMSFSAAC